MFVVLLFGTSLVWNYVTPRDRFWRPLLEGTHVSLGILFAVLILGRVIWRLTGMRQLRAEVGISGVLSRIMYVILYVLLVAEVVTGFVLRWLQSESFQFFGLLSIPAMVAPNRASANQFEQIHNWIGWAIVVLATGHAIAALVHHYVLKDRVFDRMLRRGTTVPVRGTKL
jgi:cytochrome b561